jgi:hypothetical protein
MNVDERTRLQISLHAEQQQKMSLVASKLQIHPANPDTTRTTNE